MMRNLLALAMLALASTGIAQTNWRQLEDGLELGRFKTQVYSPRGDSVIVVVRIDPELWDLRLLSLTGTSEVITLSTKQWCDRHGLTAAINAGMFHEDYRTHTGYMRCGADVNNPSSNGYKSVAAFSPKRADLPPFRIFDLDTMTISDLRADYSCLLQNLRLIDRSRRNRWTPQEQQWSEAALGEDEAGRVLFIFSRSPYSMYDFNRTLLALPLDIVAAQHLEGGTEAQMYLKSAGVELEFAGDQETNLTADDASSRAWPIPNILGISRK